MRKASLSRMPMTIAWALFHSFLRRCERTLRCLPADRLMNLAREIFSSDRHFFSAAPANRAIAANVVCAAFSPSRKSLSEYVE